MKKQGFTLIELMIALTMTAALTGALVFVFIACFRSWDAGESRAKLRTELSQSMELMVKDLRHAVSILNLEPGKISFFIVQDDGKKIAYWFYVESIDDATYQLHQGLEKETGPVIVSGLKSKEIFSTKDGRLITIDLTGAREGAMIHMRTNVMVRNL